MAGRFKELEREAEEEMRDKPSRVSQEQKNWTLIAHHNAEKIRYDYFKSAVVTTLVGIAALFFGPTVVGIAFKSDLFITGIIIAICLCCSVFMMFYSWKTWVRSVE